MLLRALTYKKWVSAFFMLVIIMPLLVSVLLRAGQHFIQAEMKKELESKNLSILFIKKETLTWTRKGKEILIGGKMFDVKTITLQGDTYKIVGLFDNKEAALVHLLKKIPHAPGHNPLHLIVLKAVNNVWYVDNKPDWQQFSAAHLSPKYELLNADIYASYCPALTGPPPKV